MNEEISDAIRRFLHERFVWVIYFMLGLCLVFSLLYIANYLGLSFFVLSHRGMVEHTVSSNLISTNWDLAVWASGVFVVIAWLFHLVSKSGDRFYRIFADLVLLVSISLVVLVIFDGAIMISLVLVSLLLFIMTLGFY